MQPAPATAIPLALYVHMPWCVKKCPYCDFNSHGLHGEPPYAAYIDALLADLDADLADFADAIDARPIVSVFFGGGTPSLFAPAHIQRFLDGARRRLDFAEACEITLETNPGTVEHGLFSGYREAGVNRLSIGVQSFDDDKLRRLGRIHSAAEAGAAIGQAREAGYTNFNLDLMYALPGQTLAGALADVESAIALGPSHISHYQLTLEPRTAFAKRPPRLPDDDSAWDMQEACQARLAGAGYAQYEVSAYAQSGRRCAHNLNYWSFGDYLGIGAGAHGKLTDTLLRVHRRWKTAQPTAYLRATDQGARIAGDQVVGDADLPFEYMLNALRIIDGVPTGEFAARTGLPQERIASALDACRERGWLVATPGRLQATPLGQRFLNDVITTFLQ